MRRFVLRLAAFFRSRGADAELSRELAAHLQLLEDSYAEQGMPTAEARAAARRAFGGQLEQVKLRQRDARSFRWLDESWLDFKLGARMLLKYLGCPSSVESPWRSPSPLAQQGSLSSIPSCHPTVPLPEGY